MRCEMFICKYMGSCLIGVDCENGKAPNCRLNFCDICKMQKQCKMKVHNQKPAKTQHIKFEQGNP